MDGERIGYPGGYCRLNRDPLVWTGGCCDGTDFHPTFRRDRDDLVYRTRPFLSDTIRFAGPDHDCSLAVRHRCPGNGAVAAKRQNIAYGGRDGRACLRDIHPHIARASHSGWGSAVGGGGHVAAPPTASRDADHPLRVAFA